MPWGAISFSSVVQIEQLWIAIPNCFIKSLVAKQKESKRQSPLPRSLSCELLLFGVNFASSSAPSRTVVTQYLFSSHFAAENEMPSFVASCLLGITFRSRKRRKISYVESILDDNKIENEPTVLLC